MIQILIWAVAVMTIVMGLLAVQIGKVASTNGKSADGGFGIIILVVAILGSGFVVWLSIEQSMSMSSYTNNLPY